MAAAMLYVGAPLSGSNYLWASDLIIMTVIPNIHDNNLTTNHSQLNSTLQTINIHNLARGTQSFLNAVHLTHSLEETVHSCFHKNYIESISSAWDQSSSVPKKTDNVDIYLFVIICYHLTPITLDIRTKVSLTQSWHYKECSLDDLSHCLTSYTELLWGAEGALLWWMTISIGVNYITS